MKANEVVCQRNDAPVRTLTSPLHLPPSTGRRRLGRPLLRAVALLFLLEILSRSLPPSLLATAATASSASLQHKFLWLSDLHYDPHYGTSLAFFYDDPDGCQAVSNYESHPGGRYGCDAPPPLVQQILLEAKTVLPDPEFVIVTGDLTRHGTEQLDDPVKVVGEIMSTVSDLFSTAFPGVGNGLSVVVPTLGNNDVTPDYYLNVTERPNVQLSVAADALRPILRPDEIAPFRTYGRISRRISPSLVVLSLNTILYSSAKLPDQSDVPDPFGQFAWLRTHLDRARTRKSGVYIVGHIPPTVGSYRHTQLWHTTYVEAYTSIVSEYGDAIVGQLFGHLHSDEYRILDGHPTPIYVAGSVTPVFGSNPNFRIVSYSDDACRGSASAAPGCLLDYEVYYADMDGTREKKDMRRWKRLYGFAESYGVADLSLRSLIPVVDAIGSTSDEDDAEDDSDFANFLSYLHADPNGNDLTSCYEGCRVRWGCTFRSATSDQYNECLADLEIAPEEFSSSSWTGRKMIATIAGGLLAVVAFVMSMAKRYRRMRLRKLYEPQNVEVDDGAPGSDAQPGSDGQPSSSPMTRREDDQGVIEL